MIEQKKLSYRDTVRYGSCVANMVFGSGEGQITIKFSGELHPPDCANKKVYTIIIFCNLYDQGDGTARRILRYV